MPLPTTDDPLEDYDKFEQLEGLRRIRRKGPLTPRNLLKMLKRYGPLFATIMTSIMAPDGTYFPMGHAIVVTGIHGTMVYYNDPNHPSRIIVSVNEFRRMLASPDALLYKNGAEHFLAIGHHRRYL